MTLLDLLFELQRGGVYSEQALVSMAIDRITTGSVVLCGIFSTHDSVATAPGLAASPLSAAGDSN